MVELLSPGGDMEKIRAALHFGADAVYCGGPALHLRAQPAAMTMQRLEEAIRYTHERQKKIYVAVNAFARNDDFAALPDYLRQLCAFGADAVIVSDLGVLRTAAETVPDLPVHISTQASCLNYQSANQYYQLGARRIILGRELSLGEIRRIREKTPPELELETFIHGAMCMAYSGRCLISAFLTGRDANRGDCTQPCRWKYSLVEQSRPAEAFPVYEEQGATTIMSSRDLKTLSFLDEIIAAGVTSLKIEGRMKSPYYVATVTGAYRRALDGAAPPDTLEKELDCTSHREYSSGFYFGQLGGAPPDGSEYVQDCVFIAVVTGRRGKSIEIEQRNRFFVGDTLEVLSPDSLGESFTVTEIKDESGQTLTAAQQPQQKLLLDCPFALRPGDILRRRKQDAREQESEADG